MKILWMLPGQGSQYPHMLQDLPANSAALAQAKQQLGDELAQLDSPSALQDSRAVQLCLLISGVAWGEYLLAKGIPVDLLAGLSIGGYPAAVLAGVLSFEHALTLVSWRGRLMQQAYPTGYGLTAISGLSQTSVENLLVASGAYLANINAEDQMVIAGSEQAMQQVAQKAQLAGARKISQLAVSVPSHCPLLAKPAEQLRQIAQASWFQPAKRGYLSANSARVLWQADKIADDLLYNLCRPVNWYHTMIAAEQHNVGLAIALPPGNTLSRLAKQTLQQAMTFTIGNDDQASLPYWVEHCLNQ